MSVHEEPERPEIEIYREMFDHLEDIVFCHDLDGRFLFMRPAAEKFLGYRSEDLPGLDFAKIIPTDYLEEAMRRTELAKLDAAGQPDDLEAEGVVEWDNNLACWLGTFNSSNFRHHSENG